jgi:purine catabolism regulator
MVTLRDVLAMPAMRQGEPRVVTGNDQLDNEVEWVQATEVTDVAHLREGDLVLTTGIAMPDAEADLASFGKALAWACAAGLIVELGRRWSAVPPALIEACREHRVPLVALHREVRFAAVTQAVCEQLVEAHVSELREHQRIDAIFTELSLKEAPPEEIVSAVRLLTAASVVLESDGHDILLFQEGPDGGGDFLEDWRWRSRRTPLDGRTTWDASYGWLLTRLGRPERPWGRLVLVCPTPPGRRDIMVVERAAAALTMHRVHGTTRASQLRRRHHEALSSLMSGASGSETRRHAMNLGFPAFGRRYAGLAIAPATPAATVSSRAQLLDDIVKATLRAAELSGVCALAAAFDGHVKALVAVDQRSSAEDVVDRMHLAVSERVDVVTGAGSTVAELGQADHTIQEAALVLVGARRQAGRGVQRLASLRVRGLLGLLHGDDRVQVFARRQLAPLRYPGGARSRDLEHTLAVLLEEWGSKSAAASRLNISRSVLYERIERIQRLIAARLDDPEVRTSLHLALLYADMADERTSA